MSLISRGRQGGGVLPVHAPTASGNGRRHYVSDTFQVCGDLRLNKHGEKLMRSLIIIIISLKSNKEREKKWTSFFFKLGHLISFSPPSAEL